MIVVLLGLTLVKADVPLRAQGGLEALGGLGELVESFFAHDAYVGSTRVHLMRLRDRRTRLRLQGFSVDPPSGGEWYLAYSTNTNARVIQTAWFVKDPHRFTSWGKKKGDRIASRPSSLVAKLEFLGTSADDDFTERVKRAKAAEWATESVRVLDHSTRPVRVGNAECAEYQARLVDRRAPPGFDEQPFLVTLAGRACPHPDAPGLIVDVSRARRTAEGEPTPPEDVREEAFVRSLALDAFNGPVILDMFLLDRAERPQARGSGVWVEGTALTDGAVWVSHRVSGRQSDALWWLSRIDTTSNRPTAQVPVRGAVVGTTGNAVWLFGRGTAWRLDSGASGPAVEIPLACAPFVFSAWHSLEAGDFGVWLGCRIPDERKRSRQDSRGLLRRLDPVTGAPVAELAMPRPPARIKGALRLAWVQEAADWHDKSCRLHAIDTVTNRLTRTLELGSFACRDMATEGDEAWMLREMKGRDEIVKLDLAGGRIVTTVRVPEGRSALDLAIGRDFVWVSTTPEWPETPTGARLGSAGGLLRIDRATGQLSGPMVATGTVNRLIGIAGGAVWLYDSEGAILKVRERSP